ncbi:hypothetical protein HW555_014162, partial [Spodoptera exigua]
MIGQGRGAGRGYSSPRKILPCGVARCPPLLIATAYQSEQYIKSHSRSVITFVVRCRRKRSQVYPSPSHAAMVRRDAPPANTLLQDIEKHAAEFHKTFSEQLNSIANSKNTQEVNKAIKEGSDSVLQQLSALSSSLQNAMTDANAKAKTALEQARQNLEKTAEDLRKAHPDVERQAGELRNKLQAAVQNTAQEVQKLAKEVASNVESTNEKLAPKLKEAYENFSKHVEEVQKKVHEAANKHPTRKTTLEYHDERLQKLEEYWSDFKNNDIQLALFEGKKSGPYYENRVYERLEQIYEETKSMINKSKQRLLAKIEDDKFTSFTQLQQQEERSSAQEVVKEQREREEVTYDVKNTTSNEELVVDQRTKDMLNEQRSNIKAFERTIRNMDIENLKEKWQLEDKLRSVTQRWEKVDTTYWKLDNILVNMQAFESDYNRLERLYEFSKEQINKKIWENKHQEKSTPQIELPIFSGSYAHWDPLVVHILMQKLDADTCQSFKESMEKPKEMPSLNELLKFIETKFMSMESGANPNRPRNSNSQQQNTQPKTVHNATYSKPKAQQQTSPGGAKNMPRTYHNKQTSHHSFITCPKCNKQHGLYNCREFLSMSPDERLKTANNLHVCLNCLFSHNGEKCTSEKRCKHCDESHSSILHDAIGLAKSKTNRVNVAQQTHLGWIVCGNYKTFNCHVIVNNIQDLAQFWEQESLQEEKEDFDPDNKCEQLYKETTTRLPDGRYQVRLPLKDNFIEQLGTSKPQAIAQFQQLERRMPTRQSSDGINVTPFEPNRGVYFDKIGNLQTVHDDWKI